MGVRLSEKDSNGPREATHPALEVDFEEGLDFVLDGIAAQMES
jgi:hypothetical protein